MADRMGRDDGHLRSQITVIIPALNEERWIAGTIGQFDGADIRELIVVDGGSTDATVEIARAMGARVLRVRANRGRQQNLGAEHSTGAILLFLHADTTLPDGFEGEVRETLSAPGVSAGAFRFATDARGWRMRLVERMVAIRCGMFEMPYGDQAIFMARDTFRRLGGFAEWPVMEDFDMIRRLKKQGRIALARGTAMTSARRWQKEGIWRLTWVHQMCVLGYYLGVPPDQLERLREAVR